MCPRCFITDTTATSSSTHCPKRETDPPRHSRSIVTLPIVAAVSLRQVPVFSSPFLLFIGSPLPPRTSPSGVEMTHQLPLRRDPDGQIYLDGTGPVSVQVDFYTVLGNGGQGAVFMGRIFDLGGALVKEVRWSNRIDSGSNGARASLYLIKELFFSTMFLYQARVPYFFSDSFECIGYYYNSSTILLLTEGYIFIFSRSERHLPGTPVHWSEGKIIIVESTNTT